MLNLAVIGMGRMGRLRAEVVSAMPDANIVAAADAYATPAMRDWAKRLGISEFFDGYDKIMDNRDIDAVMICTPNATHFSIAAEAAKRGKQIFCEKSVAERLQDGREICRIAEETGTVFQVGFNRRFDHNYSALQKLVADGTLGDIYLVRIPARDIGIPPYAYVAHSGGMFMDFQIHDFDMLRYLTGQEVDEVFAYGDTLIDTKLKDYADIDTCVVTLRLHSGALAVIDASRFSAAKAIDRRAELSGSKGQAFMSNDRDSNIAVTGLTGTLLEKPIAAFSDRFAQSYVTETQEFVRALVNHTPVRVTARDGYEAMRIAFAANLSMKEHRPVKMNEVL